MPVGEVFEQDSKRAELAWQELWEELRNVRQEQRDLRTALDRRNTNTGITLDRTHSETREDIKNLGTRIDAGLERARSEARDDMKTLETKLDTVGDKLRTELKRDIAQLRRDSEADVTRLSEKFDRYHSEVTSEIRYGIRWSIRAIITSVLATATIAAGVIVALSTRGH